MIEKVLVSVMTYPTLSDKHFETVCTAGFREDGSWIRIFPVPHRLMKLQEDKAYRKWQWINVDLVHRPERDDRPESFRIRDIDTLKPGNIISTKSKNGWSQRWEYVKKNKRIYTNMSELIELANDNKLSLAVLKPSRIETVVCEKYTSEELAKFQKKLSELQARYNAGLQQTSLWDDSNHLNEHFKFAEKIPYKFSYKFFTDDGKPRTLMIEDWEIVELYRNCIQTGYSEDIACKKVRDKYMQLVRERDVYLFLGTIYKWQKMNGTNPFVIIGVFYPPKGVTQQLSLDF